jgi:hypothetical protein
MIAGHYATAYVAKQHAPAGHLTYFLVASQLPDLAWYAMYGLGLDPVPHSHGGTFRPEIMLSHDLIPALGWIGLAVVAGRAAFGDWRTGIIGGIVVVGHVVADLISGFSHNLFGPDTMAFGFGLYDTAPQIAIGIEILSAVLFLGWVLRREAAQGIRRGRRTWAAWGLVFGVGLLSSLATADMLTEMDPNVGFDNPTAAALFAFYLFQIGVLTWGEGELADALGSASPA